MPRRTDFGSMACSIARTWNVLGEPWTPLVLRDIAIGLHRFDDLRADLGIATNVLSARLRRLEDEGVVERRPYSEPGGRSRDEYHLTASGREVVPILVMITNWGDRWLATDGPPAVFNHICGAERIGAVAVCSECGEPLDLDGLSALPGPGARKAPGTAVIGGLGGPYSPVSSD